MRERASERTNESQRLAHRTLACSLSAARALASIGRRRARAHRRRRRRRCRRLLNFASLPPSPELPQRSLAHKPRSRSHTRRACEEIARVSWRHRSRARVLGGVSRRRRQRRRRRRQRLISSSYACRLTSISRRRQRRRRRSLTALAQPPPTRRSSRARSSVCNLSAALPTAQARARRLKSQLALSLLLLLPSPPPPRSSTSNKTRAIAVERPLAARNRRLNV